MAHLKTALGGWKSGTSAYELRQRKPPIDFFDSSYGLLGSELRRYEIKGLKGTDPVMRSYNFEVDLYVWYPDIREEHVHNRVFTVWRRPDGTWSISSVGD